MGALPFKKEGFLEPSFLFCKILPSHLSKRRSKKSYFVADKGAGVYFPLSASFKVLPVLNFATVTAGIWILSLGL